MEEKKTFYMSGYVGIASLLVILIAGIGLFIYGASHTNGVLVVLGIILLVGAILFLSSLTIVSPNQAKAILFFGRYLGTIKENGLFITIPFTQKMNISLKVRNFNSSLLKVNDSDGNPIEISAVIVFRVVDTAKALFNVDYYEVIETRLNHLAYATEIASSMLQRQQAKAILAARQTIVEGAVSMTQMALEQIEEGQEINFTDERKVQLINNLLVSIITDKGTQPVINTGDVSS
ncbi:SPFH domain-containing protein [Enterococcus faecalis]|uniref:SPFH domain-containing protein n=1 Tax=Enterococcus faecalis TaxID=1351 RepID=UPI0024AFC544|nr:SPFH domain-containing protein [Enterococcus faecalis]MDI7068816.1 SPFH domain-containing protein [Enterococcus faecalis]